MSEEEGDQPEETSGPTGERATGRDARPRGGVCRPGVNRLSTPDDAGEPEPGSETSVEDSGAVEIDVELPETAARTLEGQADGADIEFDADKPVETQLRWEGPGKIVYEPRMVRTGPDRFAIEARRERRGMIPWGFWGGILFLGVAAAAVVGAENFYTLWDVLWVLVGLTVGALLYRFGRQSTLEDVHLCTVDESRRVLEWPGGAQSGLEETIAAFDEITEVVFGMTALPVDEGRPDVRVDAFALLVRTSEEALIPVVEGSPYKEEVHEIGKFLAEATETELTYVGRGIDPSS